jgi:hypothetical protein
MKISTSFNQKYLRAKSKAYYANTFQELFSKENDRFNREIVKDTEVNIIQSVKIDNVWYHEVSFRNEEMLRHKNICLKHQMKVWVLGSDFHNVQDPIVYAHIKISELNCDDFAYITVATTRKPEIINGIEQFNYGFSICAPSDTNKFSKKFGREKAKLQLSKKEKFISLQIDSNNQKTYDRCFNAMMQYLKNNWDNIRWLSYYQTFSTESCQLMLTLKD